MSGTHSSDTILKAITAAFMAFIAALGVPPATAETLTADPKPKPGRKPKDAPVEAKDAPVEAKDELDDDLGGTGELDDGLGGGELDDDFADVPVAKGPTKEDVRKALVALKEANGSGEASKALIGKAIGNDKVAPLLDNVPAEKYQLLLDAANKRVAAAKAKK